MLDKVGTGLLAETPKLVAADGRLSWRVPVILALPGRGRLGEVGTIDVDVQTGQVLADEPLLSEIARHANQLAIGPAL